MSEHENNSDSTESRTDQSEAQKSNDEGLNLQSAFSEGMQENDSLLPQSGPFELSRESLFGKTDQINASLRKRVKAKVRRRPL